MAASRFLLNSQKLCFEHQTLWDLLRWLETNYLKMPATITSWSPKVNGRVTLKLWRWFRSMITDTQQCFYMYIDKLSWTNAMALLHYITKDKIKMYTTDITAKFINCWLLCYLRGVNTMHKLSFRTILLKWNIYLQFICTYSFVKDIKTLNNIITTSLDFA